MCEMLKGMDFIGIVFFLFNSYTISYLTIYLSYNMFLEYLTNRKNLLLNLKKVFIPIKQKPG